MAKITFNTILSAFQSLANMNSNWTKVEDEFNDKVLYRDNPAGEPNAMANDLLMGTNRIKNLEDPVDAQDGATKDYVDGFVTAVDSGTLVSVSADDTTPSFLLSKVAAGPGIVLTETNPGGDEDLTVEVEVTGAATNAIITTDASDNLQDSGKVLTDAIPGGVQDNLLTIDAGGNNQDGGAAIGVAANNVLQLDASAQVPFANKSAFRGALVYNNGGNLTTTTGVGLLLDFDSEEYDSDSIHDTGVNPDRLVVPSSVSKVRIKTQVQWASNVTGWRAIDIFKNAGGSFEGQGRSLIVPVTGTSTIHACETAIIDVSPGDYFTTMATQNSGGNLDVQTGPTFPDRTWFAMEIIE